MRKILFFIVGTDETANEMALIANITGNVQIRSNTQISAGDSLEPADGLAGTIPASYKTASGNTIVDTALYPAGDVTPNNFAGIDGLFIYPAVPGITGTGTLQLRAVKVEEDPATGVITATEVTTGCAWSSSVPGKATVGASTGLATGVAAGATVITASYDYDGAGSNPPITKTANLTVS